MSDTDSHATFQAPELSEVATLFPNYDVYNLIACGGMGAVYHANQRSLDRDVAIKILPREFSLDAEFRVSFAAEAKAMARLNHPNLIGVYDFGDVGGLLYIVMEYVPGSSLYAVSNGRVVHQDDALKMVIDVCRGLANAHQYGILHRDIKPSNILMDANANPKIGDFGLASALGKQVQEGDQIFGTPGYTAPEVIDPPHVFDHRADIFSVGVMLHELLTGITPNGEAPLSPLPATTNPKLRAIIQRATHPKPDQRHASAEELAADLEKIAAIPHNPLLVTSAARSRVASPIARRRVLASSSSSSGGGAVFLIVILILAIVAIYFLVIQPSSEPPEETNPAPRAPGAQATPTPPAIQKPTRRKTAAEEGLKPMDDVEAFFIRVEGIMKERFKSDLDTYRQGLQSNTENFEKQARQLISSMDAGGATTPLVDLASTMQLWRNQNFLMSDSLPASLGNIASVQQAFVQAYSNQSKLRSRFYQRLRSEQTSYIRGLNKQIEIYREGRDFVAITLLEKEIARLGSESGYYEFLMSQ